jgi:hypothetical protein
MIRRLLLSCFSLQTNRTMGLFLIGIAGEKLRRLGFRIAVLAQNPGTFLLPTTQESARGAPHTGARPCANLNSFFRETGLAEILPF